MEAPWMEGRRKEVCGGGELMRDVIILALSSLVRMLLEQSVSFNSYLKVSCLFLSSVFHSSIRTVPRSLPVIARAVFI